MSNFTNETYGYSIDYPQNWTFDDSASYQVGAVSPETVTQSGTLGNHKAGMLIMVNITLSTADKIPLDTYYQNIYKQFSQSASTTNIKEISAGNGTFGQNISGYTATWEVTDTAGKWKYELSFSELQGSYSYYYLVLTYYLMEDANIYAGTLSSAVESFKHTEITVTPAVAKKVYDAAPPMTIDINKQYTVTMTTAYGDMVLQLFPADAPQTVNSFVFLIREGYFDDTVFHRVEDNFVVQGGDPTGTGIGGPGYTIPDEISSRQHLAGSLSMANSGADTNGSQFFICYSAQPTLDANYTVFGQMIQGMEVLNKINKNDRLIKVTVEEK